MGYRRQPGATPWVIMPTRTGRLVKAKELVPQITRIFTNRFKENCPTQTQKSTEISFSTRSYPISPDMNDKSFLCCY